MSELGQFDRELVGRLPLPLAQLYRRTHNAKTPLDCHLTGLLLWEVAIKLLASAAIAVYIEQGDDDPRHRERLKTLERPSLGHWLEYVRMLVPVLADRRDGEFSAVADLLFGRTRTDLPRAAALFAALDNPDNPMAPRRTVRLGELFDRLVGYRNREFAHGALGQRPGEVQERMARAFLDGATEIFGRLDVLAGGRLVYVSDIRRQVSSGWLVERMELSGEVPERIEPIDFAENKRDQLPVPARLYVAFSGQQGVSVRSIYPLVIFDPDSNEVSFWDSRRGDGVQYLCYTSGQLQRRSDIDDERLGVLIGKPKASEERSPAPPVSGPSGSLTPRVRPDIKPAGETTPTGGADPATGPLTQVSGDSGPGPAAGVSSERYIGEYKLLSVLGRGGMGVVYRALQPSLGRQVALKCLTRNEPELEARFAGEIRALARVNHRNLVRIFSSGSDGNVSFYAMELVEGANIAHITHCLKTARESAVDVDLSSWQAALSTACEESRRAEAKLGDVSSGQPPDQAPTRVPASRMRTVPIRSKYIAHIADLVRQTAEAAHALHEAGVLHRDIKPSNIMVTSDGTQAVLMDLGLAHLHDDDQALTKSRQFVGTLRYASPEQLQGKGDPDRRCDVYSLGATLWELLTLRPLFGDDDSHPQSFIHRVLTSEPERPRRCNAEIPPDLEAIVCKCLEKEPARRYQSAADLANDLSRWMSGKNVAVRRPTTVESLRRLTRRHGRLAGEAALAVYAAFITLVVVQMRATRWIGTAAIALCGIAAGAACGYALSIWRRPFAAPTNDPAAGGDSRRPRSRKKATTPADFRRTHDQAQYSHVVLVYYPAPIALAYQRFRRADPKVPRTRMVLLFKAYEATLKYLVLIGLADLFHCIIQSRDKDRAALLRLLDPPPKEGDAQDEDVHGHVFDFLRQRTPMSLGSWVHALRALAKALEKTPHRVIQELPAVCRSGSPFDTETLNWILSQPDLAAYIPANLPATRDWILSQRNLVAHLQASLEYTDEQCNDVIDGCQRKLNEMLDSIRFVRSYPLGFFERVLQHGSAKNVKSRYHLHSCMGVLGTTSRRGVSIEVEAPFADKTPFLVSPTKSQLLYLAPFYSERQAEHSQRPTLYGFEEIADNGGRYMTQIRSCAIDAIDPWKETLHEQPQDNFDWFVEELTRRPICQSVSKDLDLADELLPSRGELADTLLDNTYRLEGLIAEGGFARVYSARTLDDNLVAVKVLDLETQEPFDEFVGRFQREFDKLKLAGERHPGIIRCYKWGVGLIDKSDYPYYSMEFADGGDLGMRIDERRAALRETIPWLDDHVRAEVVKEFISIVDAVAHLHTRMDFVHRDIKPSNVLLVGGEIRLADFGMVKHLRPADRRISSKPPGTPVYRAPEQERGEEVTATADVYSLGIVLAELATGTLPVPKIDTMQGSTLDPGGELRHFPKPMRPAYENLAKLAEPLRNLIYRCTDIDPGRRPRDASVVLREFEEAAAP